MPVLDRGFVACVSQSLGAVLAEGLEQPEPGGGPRPIGQDQRLVHEVGQAVEHVSVVASQRAHRARGVEAEPSCEDRDTGEELLLGG